MFSMPGGWEWLIICMVVLVCHIPIYKAYRRNKHSKKPPKVWVAIILSFIPGQSGGILYVVGIIPAIITFF